MCVERVVQTYLLGISCGGPIIQLWLSGSWRMSYDNVIGGKLKLKGKALDVKAAGMNKKKKKKSKESVEQTLLHLKEKEETEHGSDGDEKKRSSGDWDQEQGEGGNERQFTVYEDHRTSAEKRNDEQRIELETRRLAKIASKSHRQKIEEFNQYLANLSEHYDIPKDSPTWSRWFLQPRV